MLHHAVLGLLMASGLMQEPEPLESGAGAGTQDVTELDAWQKCGALAALGMTIDEVPTSALQGTLVIESSHPKPQSLACTN